MHAQAWTAESQEKSEFDTISIRMLSQRKNGEATTLDTAAYRETRARSIFARLAKRKARENAW